MWRFLTGGVYIHRKTSLRYFTETLFADLKDESGRVPVKKLYEVICVFEAVSYIHLNKLSNYTVLPCLVNYPNK